MKIWIDFFTLHVILSFRHTKITMTDIKGKDYDHAKDALNNVNISEELVLITPEELKQKYPLSRNDLHAITQSRQTISGNCSTS